MKTNELNSLLGNYKKLSQPDTELLKKKRLKEILILLIGIPLGALFIFVVEVVILWVFIGLIFVLEWLWFLGRSIFASF